MFPNDSINQNDNLNDNAQPETAAGPDLSNVTPDQVFQLLQKEIETLLVKRCDVEVDFEKTWQLMRLRKADLYYRGLQFLYPTYNGGYVDWSSVGTPSASGGDGSSMDSQGIYDYNIDIVQSYGKKYYATLGMRPYYNVKAVPDDPQSELDRKTAQQYDLIAGWVKPKWKIRVKNIEMFYLQYVGGTVYPFVTYVADKDVFGEDEVPQMGTKQVPDPATGQMIEVPDPAPPKKFPASGPVLYLLSGDTVTTPFYVRDFNKCPYLLYEYEENQGKLLQMFGKVLRDRMNSAGDLGSAESGIVHTQGKLTRQSEQSLTGMYRQGAENTWTYSRYWLASSMYEFVQDDSLRQIMYSKFPNGLKISRVEGVVCKLEDEALTECWGAVTAAPSKTIYTDPVCWSILGNQDAWNDLYNIKIAKEERGLPQAIADADLIDTDDLNRRPYLPKEVISAKAEFGGSIRDAICPLPTPNSDDGSSSELLDRLQANTESQLGTLPVVYGAAGTQETAAGQRMELSQGLMQLSVPGELAADGYVGIFTRAVNLIKKYAPQGFRVPVPDDKSGKTSEMLDLDSLRSGKAHFESSPSTPMSYNEKVEQANKIIQENPALAEAMGFHAPLSAAALREFLMPDMPEIRSPIENVRDKVIERIQQLVQQEPIPGPLNPDGSPGPMQPSIQPEDYVDDPAQHAEITREWLNDAPGRKLASDPQRMANYQNVVAYGLLCAQKAVPPPPPPEPMKPPKVSVSLKGEDLGPLGVSQAVAGDFGSIQPGPGGPGTPPPNSGPVSPVGPGGQNGPPPASPQSALAQPGPPGMPPANGAMPEPPMQIQ